MKKKKPSVPLFVILVLLVLFLAFSYVFFGSQPGIKFSCTDRSILGFQRVPPPLMASYQEFFCKVSYNATKNSETICSGEKLSILAMDIGVLPCSNLNNYINETIKVTAYFFNENNNPIGDEVTKELVYKGL